ncbi:MAG TPA: S9 family peptidase [Gemmatimonadaceae bacterium]
MRVALRSLALLSIAATLPAQSHRFDLDDFSRIARVADPQISPDGKSVLVVVSHANLDQDRYDPELTSVDVATGKSTVLVSGMPGLASPRFSPDGQRIAFLANVGGTGPAMATAGGSGHLQLFLLKPGNKPVGPITSSPKGLQQIAWSPDGKTIAFATADEPEQKTGPERFNDSFEIQVNDDFLSTADKTPTHIWLVSSDGGTPRRLTSGVWSLPVSHPPGPPASPITWTPDGSAIVFARQPSAHGSGGNDLQVVMVSNGSVEPLKTGTNVRGTFPQFSPTSKQIMFLGAGGVSVWTRGDSAPVTVTRGFEHAIDRVLWSADGKSVIFGANDSARVSLWIQPIDGGALKRLDLGGVSPANSYYIDMAVGRSGAIAFTASSPTRPAELYYMASPDAPAKRLTDVNAQVSSIALGKTEMIDWKNENFYENGLLTYPPDFDPSKKYPLVLVIHGGPRGASLMNFGAQAQLLAAKGWLVFQPNYRGSDHLGNTYQQAIRNDAGAGPGRDVMAGIEVIKQKGIVDTAKMAVSGWSYGGYMTSWMLGHYNIWKVAVAGAAVTDQLDQQMLGDGANYRGANSPYVSQQAMDRIHEQSPITYVKNMKAPTLILSDVGDFRVPITESYKLFHGLKDNGVVTQFFAYPISGHNPADPVRQRDVQRRWMSWLEQYLSTSVTP